MNKNSGFYGGFVVQKSLFFFDTNNPEAGYGGGCDWCFSQVG